MQPHELMTYIRLADTGEMREWLEILERQDYRAYLLFVQIVMQNPAKRQPN